MIRRERAESDFLRLKITVVVRIVAVRSQWFRVILGMIAEPCPFGEGKADGVITSAPVHIGRFRLSSWHFAISAILGPS